jgi:hypothetical protein
MGAEWSKLKKRIGSDAKDVMIEWNMPLDSNDAVGITAWSKFAAKAGAVFFSGEEPSVSWDTPIVAKMKRSLAWAISIKAQASKADAPLIARVVADLQSYRNTGHSVAGVARVTEDADAGSGAQDAPKTTRAVRGRRRR